MRTADLIELLARDVRATPPGVVSRKLLAALVAGGAVTLAMLPLLFAHDTTVEKPLRKRA